MGLHSGTVNRLQWIWRTYPFHPGEVCCAITPLVFVDSIREILAPLLQGMPLALFPEDVVVDPFQLVERLKEHRITRLCIVPALLNTLLDALQHLQEKLPNLRYCFVSGEVLVPPLAAKFFASLPYSSLINVYGCSEASGDSTFFELPESWSAPYIPIGRAIDNHQIFILDPHLQPVPVGVPGEIFIGGAGLARGYLNHPEWDMEKFIASPFSSAGDRLYRTGDVGCYLGDGNIRYLGRGDRQVKLRGIRIELDEIEKVMREHPLVWDAAVISWERATGVTLIAAFVVSNREGNHDVGIIREYLKSRLPEPMVPAAITVLDALPLLANGKVNRRGLSALVYVPEKSARESKSPRTSLELSLSKVWARVLGVEKVGVNEDFFELGGHSLLAAQLVIEIQKELGWRIPLVAVFQAPTIEQIARIIEQPYMIAARSTLVRIQPSGSLPPFYCVHGVGGGVWGYERLGELLGHDRPFYGLQARGVDGVEEPDTSLEEMAVRYIKAMKTVHQQGPIYLGGYSYGGYVAFEMAHQLRKEGCEIAALVMFDTPAPHSDYRHFKFTLRSMRRFVVNFPCWSGDFIRLESEHRIGRLKRYLRLASSHLRSRRTFDRPWEIDLGAFFDTPDRIPAEIRRLMEIELAAFRQYSVRPYPGRVMLLRAQAQPLFCSHDPIMGWGTLALGGVDIIPCPGSHHTLLKEPFVGILARQLRSYLAHLDSTTHVG
jgi:thioesterase domain-containing protein/acyl carrier protein